VQPTGADDKSVGAPTSNPDSKAKDIPK